MPESHPHQQRQTTIDGFEILFGTNHLAAFALTAQLMPSLKRSKAPRVVTLSSLFANFRLVYLNFDDLQNEKSFYWGLRVYAQSKLANILFAFELQRRSDANGWGLTAIPCHPGFARTDMTDVQKIESLVHKLLATIFSPFFSHDSQTGANACLLAATSTTAKGREYHGYNGFFQMNRKLTKLDPPSRANDLKAAKKLWEVSQELTGVSWE